MLERILGIWKANNEMKEDISELIIDGNNIEFYSRCDEQMFPCTFVGKVQGDWYKVFSKGRIPNGLNKTLHNSRSYYVPYVLRQSEKPSSKLEIKDIEEVSFIIPEIIDWFSNNTVNVGITGNQELFAVERKFKPLVLHEGNPYIEIRFESQSLNQTISVDKRTTFVVKIEPRLFIKYEKAMDFKHIESDIECLMQFWGLMIGYVSTAEDIRIRFEGEVNKSQLYINQDLSYNLRMSQSIMNKPRTTYEIVGRKIGKYFTNWHSFYFEKRYEFIRHMYFAANKFKNYFAEELFLEYVKILEGYSLRETNDEENAQKLKKTVEQHREEIRKLIFTNEGKSIFRSVFEEALTDWKFNSKHADNVAEWIANGYMNRISLESRIKKLDEAFFGILAYNAIQIEKLQRKNSLVDIISENDLIKKFFKDIVSTRNYYSHYKVSDENILEYMQLDPTIRSMKALIIAILYSKMGMCRERIQRILINDSELCFQTNFLYKEEAEHILTKTKQPKCQEAEKRKQRFKKRRKKTYVRTKLKTDH